MRSVRTDGREDPWLHVVHLTNMRALLSIRSVPRPVPGRGTALAGLRIEQETRRKVPEPILHRVAAGDPLAVPECLERYGGLVWSLARRFCSNRDEAEEAVQEAFIEIWKKAGRYDPALASEITFVAMIARRRLIDRGRRGQRALRTEGLDDESILPTEDHEQELVDIGDEARKAAAALARLRPDEQRVLKLAIYDGLSHDQIAKTTTLPLGTVKTHLRRGLARVREMLGVDSTGAPGGVDS